ncbi:MAG: hypothetical protein HKP56_20045 [Anderseniella sp.]|nr:hypothetical protein [Anderseniella sp.]
MKNHRSESELEKALLDPAASFKSPADVLNSQRFSQRDKIEILRRWEYDAVEMSVAGEEGMVGPNGGDLLQQIVIALRDLAGDIDTDHTPPTKQGGLARYSVKPRA